VSKSIAIVCLVLFAWAMTLFIPRADSTRLTINATNGAFFKPNYFDRPIITNIAIEGSTLFANINGLKVPFTDEAKSNLVVALVASRLLCDLRGHAWEVGCGVSGCLVIHYEPMRHCIICGKVESQQIGPWR